MTAGAIAVLTAFLLAVPVSSVTAAAPSGERAVPPPTGTTHLSATAFAGPGSSYAYDSGDVTHAGAFDDARSGSANYNDGILYASASVSLTQTDTATPTKVTSTGTTSSTLFGGSTTARNEVTTTFTPTASSRWKITVQAQTQGAECINGNVTIGRVGGPSVVDQDISCETPTYSATRYVDLLAGTRYFYSAGHPTTSAGNSQFTWTLTLEQSPAPVKNTVKPTIKLTNDKHKVKATNPGSWSGFPTTFAYQWLRNGKLIKGARAKKKKYSIRAADAGRRLSVKVTATGPGGTATAKSKKIKIPS